MTFSVVMNREVNWLEYNKILKKSKAENQNAVRPGPKNLAGFCNQQGSACRQYLILKD